MVGWYWQRRRKLDCDLPSLLNDLKSVKTSAVTSNRFTQTEMGNNWHGFTQEENICLLFPLPRSRSTEIYNCEYNYCRDLCVSLEFMDYPPKLQATMDHNSCLKNSETFLNTMELGNQPTPYWPQSNELTENFNKSLAKLVNISIFFSGKNWKNQQHKFLLQYRTTPAKFMFGKDQKQTATFCLQTAWQTITWPCY